MPTSDNCHGGGPTAERDDCYVAPLDKAIDPGPIADGAEARLHLAGLGCTNCVTRVRNALLAVDGVIAVDVSLQPQRAVAIYDPSRTLPDLLIEAVLRSGAASHHAYRAAIVEVRSLAPTVAHTDGRA
jgi:copper chaperone CopZ